MDTTSVVSYPARTLSELTQAITLVNNQTTVFGHDLYVLTNKNISVSEEWYEERCAKYGIYTNSWPHKDRMILEKDDRARIQIAELIQAFVTSVAKAPHDETTQQEVIRFQEAFASYCVKILQNECPNDFVSLVDCARYCVEKIAKQFFKTSTANREISPLLLITDRDSDNPHQLPRAMGIRATRYISQGTPVLMPYELLCNLINISFLNPDSFAGTHKPLQNGLQLKTVKAACHAISDDQAWKLFISPTTNLVAVLPNQWVPQFNLLNYKQISFETIKEDAIFRSIGKPYQPMQIHIHEILDFLSSPADKHVIWAGHGSLTESMGLPVPLIQDLLNSAHNVALWDLHSCKILGNIRNIMEGVRQHNAAILVNNGSICDSDSPGDSDDSTNVYFRLASHAIQSQDHKLAGKLAKIFPLANGFNPVNHPHVILKKSTKIIPLTYPGLIETVSAMPEFLASTTDRLYLDKVIIDKPLRLTSDVALVPGLAQVRSSHLIREISTPLTFADFIRSTNKVPHKGYVLIMIGKLSCADGIYEKVISFSTPSENENCILFFKDGKWCTFDGKINRPCTDPIPEKLENFLNQAALRKNEYAEHDCDATTFLKAVCGIFNYPLKHTPLEPLPDLKMDAKTEKTGSTGDILHCSFCSLDEVPFFEALAKGDARAIRELFPQRRLEKLTDDFDFCIGRNFATSFSCLLDLLNKAALEAQQDPLHSEASSKVKELLDASTPFYRIPTDLRELPLYKLLKARRLIISSCIKMKRLEMLQEFDSYLHGNDVLGTVAEFGDPEIYALVRSRLNGIDPDYRKLIAHAEKGENWQMVAFLSQLPQNF